MIEHAGSIYMKPCQAMPRNAETTPDPRILSFRVLKLVILYRAINLKMVTTTQVVVIVALVALLAILEDEEAERRQARKSSVVVSDIPSRPKRKRTAADNTRRDRKKQKTDAFSSDGRVPSSALSTAPSKAISTTTATSSTEETSLRTPAIERLVSLLENLIKGFVEQMEVETTELLRQEQRRVDLESRLARMEEMVEEIVTSQALLLPSSEAGGCNRRDIHRCPNECIWASNE